MERYLIDTNVVSGYLSASITEQGLTFMDGVVDETPIISLITQIDFLAGKLIRRLRRMLKIS